MRSSSSEKLSDLSTRVLHHDLLVRVEKKLFEIGAAVDLNATLGEEKPTEDAVRQALEGETYLRAEGWVEFEDYKRLSAFCDYFPELVEMTRKSAQFTLKQTPEYQMLASALEQARASYKSQPGNRKSAAKQRIQQLEEPLKAMEAGVESATDVEPWILTALQRYVSMFLPDRFIMRMIPFDNLPHFQVISSMKREALVDTDLDNLLFAFGAQPNVELTILGIITSLPARDPVVHDFLGVPASQDEPKLGNDDPGLHWEMAVRGVLRSMNGFEQFFRFSRYPSVTVYPLAIYRTIPLREDVDVG